MKTFQADTKNHDNPSKSSNTPERHVVLVAPEVHWNTGNIGRTCLGAGAHLHLVRPLGFSLDDKHVKRPGWIIGRKYNSTSGILWISC